MISNLAIPNLACSGRNRRVSWYLTNTGDSGAQRRCWYGENQQEKEKLKIGDISAALEDTRRHVPPQQR